MRAVRSRARYNVRGSERILHYSRLTANVSASTNVW